jgi:hypothetical protein
MILPKKKRSVPRKKNPIVTFLPQIVLGLNLKTKIKLYYISRLISYHAVRTVIVGYKRRGNVRVT